VDLQCPPAELRPEVGGSALWVEPRYQERVYLTSNGSSGAANKRCTSGQTPMYPAVKLSLRPTARHPQRKRPHNQGAPRTCNCQMPSWVQLYKQPGECQQGNAMVFHCDYLPKHLNGKGPNLGWACRQCHRGADGAPTTCRRPVPAAVFTHVRTFQAADGQAALQVCLAQAAAP
jgi:hypothetical protein